VSDLRLKENVAPVSNALDKVLQLNGVYFTYRESPALGQQIGFIAQEVEPVVPEIVSRQKLVSTVDGHPVQGKDEYLYIAYGPVVALLVNAVKEMDATIKSMDARLKDLENK
jgi:hypothetical protein